MLTLCEFRAMVRREFGGDLSRMTPENVRGFLDRVQTTLSPLPGRDVRVRVNESQHSYDGIVREFLQDALSLPADEGVVLLWLFCLELANYGLLERDQERLQGLFGRDSSAD